MGDCCGKAEAVNPLLAELTVIVPTWNRPIAAEAVASQWAHEVAHMVIVDGSERPISSAFKRFPNVTYIHDRRSIEVRLGRASELVATRFAMLQSDDDVFIPSAIAACISELERDNSYVAISPTAIRATEYARSRLAYKSALGWDNNAPSREGRFLYLGSNYTPSCIYGVCRSEALKASFLTMAKDPVPVYAFGELHHEFVVNGLGSVKVMPVVGWIRRDKYASIDSRSKNPETVWFENPESEHRERFVEGVSLALSEALPSTVGEVRDDVELGLAAYAERYRTGRRRPQTPSLFRRMYKRLVPKPLRRAVKTIRGTYRPRQGQFMDSNMFAAQGIHLPDDALQLLQARIESERLLAKRVRE